MNYYLISINHLNLLKSGTTPQQNHLKRFSFCVKYFYNPSYGESTENKSTHS